MQTRLLFILLLAFSVSCASSNPGDGGMTGTAASGRSGGTVSTGTPAATGTTGTGPTDIPGKVRPQSGIEPDQQQQDKHLTDVVTRQLAAAGYLEKYQIEVSSSAGVVTVRGTAPTQETADAILAHVRDVEDVKDVISELTVSSE